MTNEERSSSAEVSDALAVPRAGTLPEAVEHAGTVPNPRPDGWNRWHPHPGGYDRRSPSPQHPPNPYGPPPRPDSSIVTGDSAGPTTVQQVTVNVPSAGGRTNTLAVISILAALFWVFWLGSVIALVCGLLARKQIRENGNVERGDGLALAGIILGGLELIPLAFIILVAIVGALAAAGGAGAI